MKLDELVQQYIALRDLKSKKKADFDAEVAKIDAVMDQAEAALLKMMQESGLESVKTPHGTAYSTSRTSATLADRDAFRQFVLDHDAWELTDLRCNKTAVAQFKAANEDLPPGVTWREEKVVNIRRS